MDRNRFTTTIADDSPKASSADQVPERYEDITAEWLTDILCGDVAGAEVLSLQLGPPDDGTSNRRGISVRYNDVGKRAGLPSKLFCKASTSADTRANLAHVGAAEGEVSFYKYARPRLELPAPTPLLANLNPDSSAFIIVMKDLTDEARFLGHHDEITRHQAEGMIDTLARLHSAFYESPELGSSTLPFSSWPVWWGRLAEMFEASCDKAFGATEHLMSPRLFSRRAEVWEKTMASTEAHAKLPRTLLHSDTHLSNWYVDGAGQMALTDWQAASWGHWSRDFIYAISTALTVKNRRAWERELLELYLQRLAENGVPQISTADAMANCRQQLMTALAFWTITLRPAPGMQTMQAEERTLAYLERLYAAIDDHDALDAFTTSR